MHVRARRLDVRGGLRFKGVRPYRFRAGNASWVVVGSQFSVESLAQGESRWTEDEAPGSLAA